MTRKRQQQHQGAVRPDSSGVKLKVMWENNGSKYSVKIDSNNMQAEKCKQLGFNSNNPETKCELKSSGIKAKVKCNVKY